MPLILKRAGGPVIVDTSEDAPDIDAPYIAALLRRRGHVARKGMFAGSVKEVMLV